MGEFPLPEIDAAAMPEFTDGPSAKAWLESVPLADLERATYEVLPD